MKRFVGFAMLLLATPAALHAEPVGVAPASFEATADAAQAVTFRQQPTQVGDRVRQQLAAEMQIDTTIVQSGQIAHESSNSIHRKQQRRIEVLAVADGRVRRAQVTFDRSRKKPLEETASEELLPQPVEGKTYVVTRDGEALLVADGEGNIPPREEFEIVAQSLQTLGEPNPLAEFLAGRTVTVGQRLALPHEIAERLLGMGGELGEIESFDLKLLATREVDGEPCGLFAAVILTRGDTTNPMRVTVQGTLAVQTETCRTATAELAGPLRMISHEATALGSFNYSATGSLRVASHAIYSTAPR